MSIGESGSPTHEQRPSARIVGFWADGSRPRRSGGRRWRHRIATAILAVIAVLAMDGGAFHTARIPRSVATTQMGAAAAAITLSETGGPAATSITVSGSGFASGEAVDVRWRSASATPLASARASASGTFSARLSIPDAPIGRHAVIVTGRTVTKQASATYTVTPSLSRAPAEGAPWTRIAITARGFGTNEDVRLNWLTEGGTILGTMRTNSAGTGSITITMPNGKPGWNDYTGYGLTSRGRAWGALRILSSVSLSPTSAAPGTTVQMTARGFAPGPSAQVTWNTTLSSTGSTLCRGAIAANGTLVCRFAVPRVGAGVYPVTVTTSGGTTLSATLTVTGPPSTTITPSTGAVGTNVTITAGGFAPNESITIGWDTGVSPRTVKASPQGAVSVKATVPRLAVGRHTLRVAGASSGKTATTPFTVASTPAAGTTSRVSEGIYNVYATREGLVGGTTSSGHKIVANDYFVSLPGCTPTNCPGGPYWGNMTNCGTRCYVKVVNPRTNACRVEPILDTGPWFRVDDWWNTTSGRYLNNLASNRNTLTQGYTGADAARNGLDVGYGLGPNGIGRDDTGTSPGRPLREVGNRSAIDLADGTWYDLGIQSDGTGGRVTVHMLWQTGADPASQARSCGHPLNERPVNEVTNPPGTPNPSFSGAPLQPVGSGGTAGSSGPRTTYDGYWSSAWSIDSDPSSGYFTIDYGAVHRVTGVRWGFNRDGHADQFTVQTSADRATWTTVGTFGNAPRYTWHGAMLNREARYLRVIFVNPNGDETIGQMAEIQLWGTTVAAQSMPASRRAVTEAPVTPGENSGRVTPAALVPGSVATPAPGREATAGSPGAALPDEATPSIPDPSSPVQERNRDIPDATPEAPPAVPPTADVGRDLTGSATPTVADETDTITTPPQASENAEGDPGPTAVGQDDGTELSPTEPSAPAAEPEPVVTGEGFIAFTDGAGANCRSAPSEDGEIITLLGERTTVDMVGEPTAGWQPVFCDGRAGYVFAEFISGAAPEAATEPLQTPVPTEPASDSDVTIPADGSDTEDSIEESGSIEPPLREIPTAAPSDVPTAEPTPDPTAVPAAESTEVAEPEFVTRDVVIVGAADTSVTAFDPGSAHSGGALTLPAGGEEGALAVVTFPIDGVGAGKVIAAQLVITGTGDTGGGGGQLRVVDGIGFNENSTTWNDVANAGGWVAAEVGSIQPGLETVIDVTGIVTADGTVSFVIEGLPDQSIAIKSRESGSAAYLVITIEEQVVSDPG